MSAINKYFIAIVPTTPLFNELENFKLQIHQRFNCSGALRSPAHITLHMPFDWPTNKLDHLRNTLQEFFHEKKSFDLALGPKDGFEPRVVFLSVIQNTPLRVLQKELCNYLAEKCQLFNQRDDRRGFHPHLTLAFRDLKKSDYYELIEEDWLKDFHANFNCHSVELLVYKNSRWENDTIFKLLPVM